MIVSFLYEKWLSGCSLMSRPLNACTVGILPICLPHWERTKCLGSQAKKLHSGPPRRWCTASTGAWPWRWYGAMPTLCSPTCFEAALLSGDGVAEGLAHRSGLHSLVSVNSFILSSRLLLFCSLRT